MAPTSKEVLDIIMILKAHTDMFNPYMTVSFDVPSVEEKQSVPPRSATSIMEAMREGRHPCLVSGLNWDERCAGCGMLLLDSDTKRSTRDLNIELRHRNVSVCILRSKKAFEAKVNNCEDVTAFEVACAALGTFEQVVAEWGLGRDPSDLGLPWTLVKDRLSKSDSNLIELGPDTWGVSNYGIESIFKAWWQREVDSIFNDTSWPFECTQSVVGYNSSVEDQSEMMRTYLGKPKYSLDESVVEFCMATLIGGKGSAPHIDVLSSPDAKQV